MTRFWQEPAYVHGTPPRTGILLVNLGTPAAPTAAALRPYLSQFLSDPRVVEIPRLLWWPILHGIILRTRPAKSAKKYASVWTDEGSPLKTHTEKQAKLLAGFLTNAGQPDLMISWAMRYGAPSIRSRLDEMRAAGCTRILVVPLYPQFASSTTATWMLVRTSGISINATALSIQRRISLKGFVSCRCIQVRFSCWHRVLLPECAGATGWWGRRVRR